MPLEKGEKVIDLKAGKDVFVKITFPKFSGEWKLTVNGAQQLFSFKCFSLRHKLIPQFSPSAGVFSTSNLNAMLKFCRIRLSKHPKVIARNVLQILLIRLTNPEMWGYVRGKRNNTTHTMFKIGGNDWGLKTYCITPEAQVSQLKDAGFDHIQIYDLQGKEIATVTNTADIELYYLSKVAKFH